MRSERRPGPASGAGPGGSAVPPQPAQGAETGQAGRRPGEGQGPGTLPAAGRGWLCPGCDEPQGRALKAGQRGGPARSPQPPPLRASLGTAPAAEGCSRGGAALEAARRQRRRAGASPCPRQRNRPCARRSAPRHSWPRPPAAAVPPPPPPHWPGAPRAYAFRLPIGRAG